MSRDPFVSYAQNQEDVVLARALRPDDSEGFWGRRVVRGSQGALALTDQQRCQLAPPYWSTIRSTFSGRYDASPARSP